MTTIKDVAAAAGVSTATVSAALNGTSFVSSELKARVDQAVRDLGYLPSRAARVLRRGRSELIAVSVADLSNPFYAEIIRAAESAAAAAGYALLVFNSDECIETEREILRRVRALGCDGLVMVPVGNARDYDMRLLALGPPKVLLGRSLSGEMDTVTLDNHAAGRRSTEYLLDLGHRRIGTIAGRPGTSTGAERLEGMLQAMKARGLAPLPGDVQNGDFREESAYSLTLDMIGRAERPTAVYVANGVMALGVMRALRDMGLSCPADVSIVSTDTVSGYGGISPRLTRTEHPVPTMTEEAIRLLVSRIEGAARVPRRRVFEPKLVVADSCRTLR